MDYRHNVRREWRVTYWSVVLCFVCVLVGHGAEPGGETPLPSAARWDEWRGEGRRGVTKDVSISTPLAKPLRLLWSVPLGTGWSSPVLADGRVIAMDRRGGEERVLALDVDRGDQLWKRTNAVDFDPHPVGRNHGNGPKATPLIDGEDVFTLGIAGWLQCLDAATGAPRWTVNLPAEFGERAALPSGRAEVIGTEYVLTPIGPREGAPVPLFGYTGSPALVGDLLVCSVGGARGGTIVAFQRKTGKPVWKSLSENVAYSSPVIAEIAGVTQVVAMTGPRVVGLDAKTGELLWSHPFQIQYDESISTPLVEGDLVMVTGDSRPLTALKISKGTRGWECAVAWQNRDLTSYLSSLIAYKDCVFGMDDTGRFACAQISDGRTLWSGGEHGMYCSPILAGDRLFCLNERGKLLAISANRERYQELGAAQLGDAETWTVPAIVGNRVYVRSESALSCWAAD